MNEPEEGRLITNTQWLRGAIQDPLPSIGSGAGDASCASPTPDEVGTQPTRPAGRVDTSEVHEWCLIALTKQELEDRDQPIGPPLEINLQEYGVVDAWRFVTYAGWPRPFIVAEAVERVTEDRTLLTLTENDVWLLQEGRGALDNPQLLSPLERRVMLDTFWQRLADHKKWMIYGEPTRTHFQTEAQRSKRELRDDLDDDWLFYVHDTCDFGVLIELIQARPGVPDPAFDEQQIEHLYEHVQWVKEARRAAE